MSKEGRVAKGTFSEVFEMVDKTPQLISGISNENVVVKMLRTEQLESIKSCPYSAKEKITCALNQFKFLEEYFKKEGKENPPIVQIYNVDTALSSRYTVVEKVKPLQEPLWTQDVEFSALSLEQKEHYNAIVRLLTANKALAVAGEPEMDLKDDNLGINDKGHLVLLDYVNIPFYLSSFGDSYSRRLCMGNQHIQKELEKVEESFN